jgi:hypothetical protein
MLERCFSVVPYPLPDVRHALFSDLDAWLPAALFDASHTRQELVKQLELDHLETSEPVEHSSMQIGEIQDRSGGCAVSLTWKPLGADHVFDEVQGEFELVSAGRSTLLAMSITCYPSRRHLRSRSARLKFRSIGALGSRTFLETAERSLRVRLDPRWTNGKLPARH